MAVDTIPNLIARATVVRNEATTNANTAVRVGQLFVDVVDTLNALKINVGNVPQATELTIGGLKLSTQAVAQTAGETLLANRNNSDAITARSFRWAFETMLGKEWTWLDRQVFDTAVRLAYANANEYLKLDANKDIVGVSAIDYNDLDNLPDLSLKADLVGGLVPASQLPSYVDDVLEFANLAIFPVTGETGKIYVALDTNKTYRWSGSIYVEISNLDEALLADLQNILTATANTYVSPRRFWAGIQHTVTLAWTWSLKQTFSLGINVATASAPTANGDFVFNTVAGVYQGRIGGVNYNFITSLNGKVGRVLFVSKDGNDSTAVVGSQIFTYLTIQAAITASSNGDLIVVFSGTYVENLNWTGKILSFKFYNVVLNGNIIGAFKDIDGTDTSSIIVNTDVPILFSRSGSSFSKLHNFISIKRTIANSGVSPYDVYNETTTPLIIENITEFGDVNFLLRLNGVSANSKFSFLNIKDVWVFQSISVVPLQFENCRIRICNGSGSSSIYYFRNCRIWIANNYFVWGSVLTFEYCDIYLDTPVSYQFIAVQSNANGVIKMDSCNIQSTNPTFSYLFDIIGGASALTLVMQNCKGNIPVANLRDYTATNEYVDYTYLSYLTTINEVTF